MFKASVISRISVGYTVVLLAMVAISVFSLFRMSEINSNLKKVTQVAQPIDIKVNSVESKLDQLNLSVYQHYHADTISEQLKLEGSINAYQKKIQQQLDEMARLFADLPNNDEKLHVVEQFETSKAQVFNAQKKSMNVASAALKNKATLEQYQSQIRQLDEQLGNITERYKRYRQNQQITASLSQLRYGISIAKQYLLINNLQELQALSKEYKLWLDDYVKSGYQLQTLSSNTTIQRNILTPMGAVATELAWIIGKQDGIKSLQGSYLSSKNVLIDNLSQVEAGLLQLKSDMAHISQLSQTFSATVEAQTTASVESSFTWISLATLTTLMFGILTAFYITRSISRPLKQTVADIEKLATGNLGEQITIAGKDEFAQLRQSLQSLRVAFVNIITDIKTQSEHINESVDTLSTSAQHTTAIANQQKDQTTQVASAVLEMTATSSEISDTAEQATQLMAHADALATQSQGLVLENQTLSEQLRGDMTSAAEVVASLDQECRQIQEVVNVIDTIADQTNLLALNAAIEAARAAEHGRGFAVVADEVRTLAMRTQTSTEQIQSKINQLLSSSELAVKALHSSVENTESCTQMAREIDIQIKEFAQGVSNAHQLNEVIAEAAKQQHIAAQEISTSIENIDGLSLQTLDQIQHNNAAATELDKASGALVLMNEQFKVQSK
ncbi:HAMP domain-containing methyl-accepting chemotaxis protein [Pseudoalteromonas obscura]|uniref:Methyl-accepting chemotaxis protein n=1 Tax=Pseudoalteromonas obscura TaxID=3048491 RepID=A0ABT7EM50_9GAMM|nr:methyl-accepting chemotaxis protein [Pseudoalteromonas sp. P94(2023)]MDK2596102.1 methyl-accepting chemotaxis protein [Pseudoalteromonas sp. P94(2023)]